MRFGKDINFDELKLMQEFNNKDNHAFVAVYNILYKPLYYYTSNLYKETSIDPNDIIHDMFITVWDKQTIRFENIVSIKTYFYVAIKNKFINYISQLQRKDRYVKSVLFNNVDIISEITEVEALSTISEALDLLPEECARVFELHINGWDVKSIALKLGKAQSTVYAQRNEAITILKNKLPKNKLFFILFLIN